ncbi:MAG: sugar ABC transporter substrate-binding protein [Lachnospiraceae bacterium]|nr:sugar ABC transporter substrate-binding protein [Lachnospiraceae bacterium]
MKKKLFALLTVGILSLSLLACAGNGGDDAPADEPAVTDDAATTDETPDDTDADDVAPTSDVTLEFQQWWGVELPEGFLADLVSRFTDETGIQIELLSNPFADTRTQIMAGAATATMADVVGLDGSWVYDFANQGAISNLTQLMADIGMDDSELSAQVQFEGNTYMIPATNFAYPMFVNLDILEEAGITDMPTTWSEFIAASEQVVANTDASGFAIPLEASSPHGVQNQYLSWLWASGGRFMEDGRPNLVGNSDLIATTEFVKDMFDNGVIAPGSFTMREQDMVEEFTNGRVAFMISSLAHLFMITEGAPDMNIGFIDIPVMDGYTGQSGMTVANWGLGVAANSPHQEEAMMFIEFLLSPEINSALVVAASAFPGNVNADPDYSASPPLFLDAFEIFQRNFAINEFTGLPTAEDLMRSMNEELLLFLDGDTATVGEMLEATQARWEPVFN